MPLANLKHRRELQFVAAEILNGSPSDAELSSEFMEPYRRLVILCQAYATQTLEQAATAQDKRSRTLSKPFLHFCATVSGSCPLSSQSKHKHARMLAHECEAA